MAQSSNSASNEVAAVSIEAIRDKSSEKHFCPLLHINDFLAGTEGLMRPSPILWERTIARELTSNFRTFFEANLIQLTPNAAGVPIHSGFQTCMQNKCWKVCAAAAGLFMKLFTESIRQRNGVPSVGETYENLEQGTMRMPIHMFPFATPSRITLLGEAVQMMYALDDLWEQAYETEIHELAREFIDRLRGDVTHEMSQQPLQKRIEFFRGQMAAADDTRGNGGGQVLDAMVEFAERDVAPSFYASLDDYFSYRTKSAAIRFILSCAKFSIASSADYLHPKLERFVLTISIHLILVNDLASWRKEKAAFDRGDNRRLTNFVDVTMQVLNLNEEQAIYRTYLQLVECEEDIDDELRELKRKGLSTEQWEMVYALSAMAAGHVFAATTTERYVGEAGRIH